MTKNDPTEVHNMLDDLGLLEGIGREPDNITKIIWRCLRNYRDKALISY